MRKLTIDVNECQGTSVHLCKERINFLNYEFPTKYDNQGTLMSSHYHQQENLSLMYASLRVPSKSLALSPR